MILFIVRQFPGQFPADSQTAKMSHFECLPVELVTRIISLLAQPARSLEAQLERHGDFSLAVQEGGEQQYGDLAAAALVCRTWRQVAEHPFQWKDFILVVDHSSNLTLLASLKRFSRIESLVIGDVRESQLLEVASMVANRTGLARELQQLAVQTPLLSKLSNQAQFFKGVSRVRNFSISHIFSASSGCALMACFFSQVSLAVTEGSCRLDTLSVAADFNVLASVGPKHIDIVVKSLKKMQLPVSKMSGPEVVTLFQAVEESPSLTDVQLTGCLPLNVDPGQLAKAVHGLRRAKLEVAENEQVVEVLQMCSGQIALEHLDLFVDLGALYRDRAGLGKLVSRARERVAIQLQGEVCRQF